MCCAADEVTIESTTVNSDHVTCAIANCIEHPARSCLVEVTSLNKHIAVRREEHCTAIVCRQSVVTTLNSHLSFVTEHVVDNAFAVSNYATSLSFILDSKISTVRCLKYNANNSCSAVCICINSQNFTIQINGNLLTNNMNQRINITNDFVILKNYDRIAIPCCIYSRLNGFVLSIANLCYVIDFFKNVLAIFVNNSVACNCCCSIQAFDCCYSCINIVENDFKLISAKLFIDNQSILCIIEDKLQCFCTFFAVLDYIDITIVEGYCAACKVLEANACTAVCSSSYISECDSACGICQPDTICRVEYFNVYCCEAVHATSAVYKVVQVCTCSILNSDVVNTVENHTIVVVCAVCTCKCTSVNSDVTSKIALFISGDTVAIYNEVNVLDSKCLTLISSITCAVDSHSTGVLEVLTINCELNILNLIDSYVFVDVCKEYDCLAVLNSCNCFCKCSVECIADLSYRRESRNFSRSNENFAAYRALLTFSITNTIKCRSYCGNSFFCMTICRNYFLCNDNFATYRAVLAFCKTCCCASGSYCCINYFCVFFYRN